MRKLKRNKKRDKLLSTALAASMIISTGFLSAVPAFAEGVTAQNLFFSEYIEGSSNNKAIEIFNGTGKDVDLTGYKVELYSNGATSAGNIFNLTGTLNNGNVYVIGNSAAVDAIKSKCNPDGLNAVANFNGDDVLVLKYNDTVVDSFGKIGNPKGTNFAIDTTYVRKSSVTAGDTDPNNDFDPSIEWDSYPKDTFEYLGSHTMDGFSNGEAQKVSNVKASIDSGRITKGTEIALSTITEGAEVYYTMDGTAPTKASTKYEAPIVVNEALTIKAIAVKDGMENSDVTTFEYTIKEADTVDKISDARGYAKGTDVVVEGIVTSIPGSYGQKSFYIQDATGGALVFTSQDSSAVIGNKVKVTGKTDDYNGKFEIVPGTVEILSKEITAVEPKEITLDKIGEAYEGQLTAIKKVKITKIEPDSYKNAVITVTDGNNTGIIRLDSRTGKTSDDLTVKIDDVIDVVGVVDQSSATAYRIQIRSLDDIVKADLGPDTVAPTIKHTAITDANLSRDITVNATVTDDRKVESVKVYYRVKGADTYKTAAMALDADKYTALIQKAELSMDGLEYYIEASDGTNISTIPEDKNTPYSIKISNEDTIAPSITKVTPAEGSVVKDNFKPEISVEYNDESEVDITSVKLYVDGTDITSLAAITKTKASYTPSSDLSKGSHSVKIELSDTKGNKTSKDWSFTAGELEYNIYFGELHSHTNLSDGQGTLDDAYSWAKNKAKADFFAVTDHSNSLDNDTNASFFNADGSENDCSGSAEWVKMHQTADKYNEDGKFVAIAGFEMTWSGSTGGWGHMNTFNTKGFETRNHKDVDLKNYYDKISKMPKSISQLNHPGKTFGDFGDFGFYSPAADNVVNLIEVGNGEGAVRGSGYFPSYEYYTRALDKGWHVAPTNNEDNHKGGWINSNSARTVVLAPQLTRESIFDAMSNRRVYSTEDENLKIMYSVNDKVMGSNLGKTDKLKFNINIQDPDAADKIGKVSIVSDGGTIAASKTFDTNTANWQFELDPQYKYYYVRVDQADKDIAVTAPVWTGEVTPVGISKVEVSQDPQIVGKPVDVTATVYNNGSTALQNVKVEYYKNSLEAADKIGEEVITSVGAAEMKTSKITWTPDKAGDYKIYAKVVLKVEGVDKVFTQSCTLRAANEDDIIKVVIDGGHQNQYVTGDYPGKMLTLTSLLKDRKTMLIQNNDVLTAEDLKGAKVLILTDPQSKDDSTNKLVKSNYSAEEIKAIKDFVNGGGSLIITSRADYNDKGVTDKQYESSQQGNRVLEAIGANLRFNDDEVIDKVKNGGQEYRLYFDKYTSTKYNLTKDIPDGLTYSAYSGCSVILKEGGSAENVDWLVKGHDTTEILDSDLQNDATPVAKGEVYSLAAEVLPNGSKIIVAGTTFFSDFETATGDNAYSNTLITNKIFEWMTRPGIETIAKVREDKNSDGKPDYLGKRFTVEGRVTAASKAAVKNTAFFDVIYVQDETGGITVFGVSTKSIPLGTKVRVTGFVDQYDGDAELQISNENLDIEILDENVQLVQPKLIKTGDSMKEENEGLLVKVQGTVTKITENALYIDDGTGEARVYVNGYIGDDTDNADRLGKWDSSIKVGNVVSAIGLASEDPDGHRLRVRNTAEIVKVNEGNGFSIEKVSVPNKVKKNDDAKVTIKAINNTDADKQVIVVVALYDKDNKLVNYSAVSQKIKAKESSDMTSLMRVLETGDKVKCMVWDSLEGMKALSEVVEIPVED